VFGFRLYAFKEIIAFITAVVHLSVFWWEVCELCNRTCLFAASHQEGNILFVEKKFFKTEAKITW